jgi:hypothetical protein
MKNSKKIIGITLLICLMIILIAYSGYLIYNRFVEGFYSRNTRIKIYQSQEISDPDEMSEYEDNDPDEDPILYDPDQQPKLDDEKPRLSLSTNF